jgi:hypothetical protein
MNAAKSVPWQVSILTDAETPVPSGCSVTYSVTAVSFNPHRRRNAGSIVNYLSKQRPHTTLFRGSQHLYYNTFSHASARIPLSKPLHFRSAQQTEHDRCSNHAQIEGEAQGRPLPLLSLTPIPRPPENLTIFWGKAQIALAGLRISRHVRVGTMLPRSKARGTFAFRRAVVYFQEHRVG